MLNRNTAPALNKAAEIKIQEPEKIILDNGIPLYIFNAGEQEVMKIEILFKAGAAEESFFLTGGATNELLDEGTLHHNSAQIADEFEFYGATLETGCSADWASVSIYFMNRFLENILPLFHEVITEPVFPEKELETYKTQNKQRLQVDNNKVDFLARKTLNQKLFGHHTAYGYYQAVEDYDLLERNSLADFHKKNYLDGAFAIIVSGRVEDNSVRLLNNYFSSGINLFQKNIATQQDFKSSTGKFNVEKNDAVQAGLRIGKLLFNKTNPDYKSLSILNTLLGGYFGSRLMSNIREEKGYTYGIGSGLVSLQRTGYLFITTEVGVEVKEAALKEIYHEIERLRNEPVPDEELDLVRNYLTGTFQRSIDGPFPLAERFKSILTYDLGFEYYYDYLYLINTISPEDILKFSQKYLHPESFTEVTVG